MGSRIGFTYVLKYVFKPELRFSGLLVNDCGGGCLTSGWNVVTRQNTEPVYTSLIFDCIGFSIISDVAVSSNTAVSTSCLLHSNCTVLLMCSVPELVTPVDNEPLLCDDLGQTGVTVET